MSSSSDVESLVSTLRHRNRCVYVCLTCLTVGLIATSVCGAAVIALFWGDVQKQIASLKQAQTSTSLLTSAPEANSFKSGHLAYLSANQVKVHNHTLKWAPITHGRSSSIGSNFLYHQTLGILTVKSAGSYFVYVNLRFTPTDAGCASNRVQVTLRSKGKALFTCSVDLPECEDRTPAPVTKKCWSMVHLEGKSLVTADMHVAKDTACGWKLALGPTDNDSGFGMFLVDSS
ncbi:uncharacterized protein LOC134436655 [Engraulis encrasicolus]|uniref:uncharacterized protein LOC134436655 n=1 Tax=Engraulis encrasicolus TaxID=184585 RepID=UPI002FD15DD7